MEQHRGQEQPAGGAAVVDLPGGDVDSCAVPAEGQLRGVQVHALAVLGCVCLRHPALQHADPDGASGAAAVGARLLAAAAVELAGEAAVGAHRVQRPRGRGAAGHCCDVGAEPGRSGARRGAVRADPDSGAGPAVPSLHGGAAKRAGGDCVAVREAVWAMDIEAVERGANSRREVAEHPRPVREFADAARAAQLHRPCLRRDRRDANAAHAANPRRGPS